jgi:hypothetical protein
MAGHSMNYKRKHPRRHVKCVLCTPHRSGNMKNRAHLNARDSKNLARERDERKAIR